MADSTSSFEHLVDEMLNEAQTVTDWTAALHRLRLSLEVLTAHAVVSPGFECELRGTLADAQNNLNRIAFERLDRDDES